MAASDEHGPNSQLALQVFLPDGRMDREAATALLDEDVVWDMSRSRFPDTGVSHGVEGVRRWFEGLDGAFGEVSYAVERLRESGERLALLIRVRGRGPASGIPVDYSFVPVLTFRARKIVRMERYEDWDAAMAAMGVPD
jgi:ketosteroid isomerase-like protein